ncbi:MAG: hypothetical protein ACQERJ_06750 [Bacillota bacterium]
MSNDKTNYPLPHEELDQLLYNNDSLFNYNEIAVGTNDIVDRRSYIPGDEELIDEVAREMGLSD